MSISNVPLVVNAQSASGLSLSAFVLKTLSYAITLAYSYRNQFPFSAYRENFFLTIQNTLITLLIIYYSRSSRQESSLTVAAISIVVVALTLYNISLDVLSLLQPVYSSTFPFLQASANPPKLPLQIHRTTNSLLHHGRLCIRTRPQLRSRCTNVDVLGR